MPKGSLAVIILVGSWCLQLASAIHAQQQLVQHRVQPGRESGWIRAIREGRAREYEAQYGAYIARRLETKRQMQANGVLNSSGTDGNADDSTAAPITTTTTTTTTTTQT